jgi:hypothetical protein
MAFDIHVYKHYPQYSTKVQFSCVICMLVHDKLVYNFKVLSKRLDHKYRVYVTHFGGSRNTPTNVPSHRCFRCRPQCTVDLVSYFWDVTKVKQK